MLLSNKELKIILQLRLTLINCLIKTKALRTRLHWFRIRTPLQIPHSHPILQIHPILHFYNWMIFRSTSWHKLATTQLSGLTKSQLSETHWRRSAILQFLRNRQWITPTVRFVKEGFCRLYQRTKMRSISLTRRRRTSLLSRPKKTSSLARSLLPRRCQKKRIMTWKFQCQSTNYHQSQRIFQFTLKRNGFQTNKTLRKKISKTDQLLRE